MDPILLRYEVPGGDLSRAGEASSAVKRTLKQLDLPQEVIRRVSVCLYEGEINMVIHASGGEITMEIGMDRIVMRMADVGPGIPDIGLAMRDGWSTAGAQAKAMGFGAGMGLPNMKRCSDDLRIDTTVGVGTTVTMRVDIPA